MTGGRFILGRSHRYVGLALALFLIVSGLTGSAISFSDELDAALNPRLFRVEAQAPPLSPAALAARVEQQLPQALVTYIPLDSKPGDSVALRVAPSGAAPLAYDEVFADPATGQVIGKRKWGACCFEPVHLMPFLYLAHYSLQIPGVWGILLMGMVGILWTLDCFIALTLTLPRGKPFWKKWGASWRIKRGAGAYRLNLDLHRAGGLWLWIVLLMVATSGVAMNLPDQVFRPVVSLLSPLQPSITQVAATRYQAHPEPARYSFDEAIARARDEASTRNWEITPRSVLHYPEYNAYGVGFTRGAENGDTGLGASYYYFDDQTGAVIHRDIMGEGSAGDIYAQAQYQLHTGRIVGLAGRIFICLTGLAVAMLSVTGLYIWLRKTRLAPKRKPPGAERPKNKRGGEERSHAALS